MLFLYFCLAALIVSCRRILKQCPAIITEKISTAQKMNFSVYGFLNKCE